MKNFKMFLLLGGLLTPIFAYSENQIQINEFNNLWKEMQNSSYEMKESSNQKELLKLKSLKSSLHYLPALYAKGRSFRTDDPAANFVGNLEQRSITQNDFNPAKLNDPEDGTFHSLTVGLNLPLFEGFQSVNQNEATVKMENAVNFQDKMIRLKEFTNLGNLYSELLNQKVHVIDLNKILQEIRSQIKTYELGGKKNLVGHSGLLGLKSLENKTVLSIEYATNRINIIQKQIKSLIPNLPENFVINLGDITLDDSINLINKITEVINQNDEHSFQIKAREEMEKSLIYQNKAETSHFAPRIGVFAESTQYKGDRNNANNQMVGVYLDWQISVNSYGIINERKYHEIIEEAKTKRFKEQEKSSVNEAIQMVKFLNDSIEKIKENHKMLSEQLNISKKLFLNGAINAITLTEVYSRKVEVREALTETISKYLNVKSALRNSINIEAKERI